MNNTEELLDDHISAQKEEKTFALAVQGDRALNYIIDFAIQFVLVFFGVIGIILLFPTSELASIFLEDSRIVDYVVGAIIAFTYYSFIETVTRGKTIGKYITKTRPVKQDGSPINFGYVTSRTFCRLIPFDAFSYLGSNKSGWHDRFSGTKVIKDAGWKEWQRNNQEI